MEILIQNYRGFDIKFNPEYEQFSCDIDTVRWSTKQSFASAKRWIDEYCKENQNFEPFEVMQLPTMLDEGRKLKIIGIRKDERFITEDKVGKRGQLSEYDEERYFLIVPENEQYLVNMASLMVEKDRIENKIKEESKKMKRTTVKELKSKYTQPK